MAKKEGPVAANTVKKNLSMLFNFAIKNSYVKFNPAMSADKRKVTSGGYHTLTADEISAYLDRHGPGTMARLAVLLLFYTGASRQDAARMGRQHLSKGRIKFSRGKTGVAVDIPVLPELMAELDRLPKDQLIFLTHGNKQNYTVESFGNWFRDQCNEAGLFHCSAHGLRKADARRLAEADATEWEIASYLGHENTKMAAV